MTNQLTPVNLHPRTKKTLLCELLAGRQLSTSDIEYIHACAPDDIARYLQDTKFRAELERNHKRLDHVAKYKVVLNIISGTHVSTPAEIAFERRIINRNKINYKKSFGIDFIKHVVQIALAAGPDVAAKLCNLEKSEVIDFMRSEEAKIKSYREDVLDRVVSKSLDVLDTYMDALLDENKIKEAPVKDIAYAVGVVHDKARDIVRKTWDLDRTVTGMSAGDAGTGNSTNISEVTNIVNVLIHDETAKSQVIEGALKKMNIYRADAIPTAQEIRDKKRLLANGESIDAVKDYSK